MARKSKKTEKEVKKAGKLKVIMLGGLAEIGKNLAVLEYENEMIVVDCGIGFGGFRDTKIKEKLLL